MPPKSRKKVGFFSPPDRSTKWIEKGKKRHEEEIVMKLVRSKVNDTGGGMAQLAIVKNKFKTKTHKVVVAPKNRVKESSDSSSDDEKEDAKNGSASASATAKKNDDDSISSEEIGKKRHEEGIVMKQVVRSKEHEAVNDAGGGMAQPAIVKNKFKTKTRKVVVAPKNWVKVSSDSSSDYEKEDAKNGSAAASATAKNDDDSISSEEIGSYDEYESEDTSNEEEDAKNASASASATLKKNDYDSISSEEIGSYDEYESEDTSNEAEDAKNRSVAAAPAPAKYARAQKMVWSDDFEPQPPIPPLPCGSRLLYMWNLNPVTQESDVRNFFKDAGKVVSVEFGGGDDGYVRFETYDASRQALKCNGEELNGYRVKLIYSEERTIWDLITPNPKYKYLFMGNLSRSIKESDVINFFKDDGTVRLVRLMTDGPDPVGYGHVKFASFNEALKAVQRNGQKLLDHKVELLLASGSSVWHAFTPSSRKPPRFVLRRGPGYGSTKPGAGTPTAICG